MSKSETSLPSRRDFIKVGSGALVVATLGNIGELHAAPAKNAPAASVGFWAGQPQGEHRLQLSSLDYLVPAASILSGDPSFFRGGARAKVGDVWRPETARRQAANFALDVLYDVNGEKVPYYAWSFSNRSAKSPAVRSSNVAFNVPVESTGTLDLVLTAPGGPRTIRFSVNSGRDTLKLRPGYYFVALPEGGNEPAIDWTRVRVREGTASHRFDSQGAGILTMAGSDSVAFSYLVLSLETGAGLQR